MVCGKYYGKKSVLNVFNLSTKELASVTKLPDSMKRIIDIKFYKNFIF